LRIKTFIFLLAVVVAVGAAAEAQDLKRIKIGYPAVSYNQVHIWIAKDAGLFKKHGLDTEVIFFRGGQMATQALVAGDPPIVNIGTVVQAGLQGHDVVLIASSESAYNYSVVARPGVAKIGQLKGKRLGVAGSAPLRKRCADTVEKFNLEPNKDVAVVVAGPTMERLAAVDAEGLMRRFLHPRKCRVHESKDSSRCTTLDLGIEVQGNGFATSRSLSAATGRCSFGAQRLRRSALHSAQPEETRRITARYMYHRPEVLDATYDWFVKGPRSRIQR
jgi:hypothetical protein